MFRQESAREGAHPGSGLRRLLPVPTNRQIDDLEQQKEHFARGIGFYKLAWVCFLGSFFGVAVEVLWCFMIDGHIESRAGLVYGPFNLLYGAGAIALTLALYPYRNRSWRISFFGGMLVGSAVEYLCSWLMETCLGSCSWDYSHMPFNINGRICLLYSLMWGLLGVIWIKVAYPLMAQLILQLPNRFGRLLTWGVVIFLAVNGVVSALAVMRWSQRIDGVPAANAFWQLMDLHFPDERLREVYVHMRFP